MTKRLTEQAKPNDMRGICRAINQLAGGKAEQRMSELDSTVTSAVNSIIDSAVTSVVSHFDSAITSTAVSLVEHFDSAIASTASVLSGATSNVQSGLDSAVSDINSNISVISNTLSAISNIHVDTKEPTGFADRVATLSWDDGTRTFTITGSHDIYIYGVKTTKGTGSIQIPDTTGLHWIYYDVSGTLVSSITRPDFSLPWMASVYWNTTPGFDKGLAGEERHGIVMDWETHHYLHETVGSKFESGLTGTFDDTTITIEAGEWHDEDIEHEPVQQTTCNVLYKNGSAAWEWDAGVSVYYKLNGTALRYNDGNNLADCNANRYMAMWIFATNEISVPIVALMGQRQDVKLSDARANNTYESLVFGELPFEEMKVLFRVILRSTGSPPTFVEVQDLRSLSNIPAGTFVATDHAVLTGLLNDNHTQYPLLAGRIGGQILAGSDTTGEDLTLKDNTIDNNTITVTQAIAAHTHISNNGSDHGFIDQAVTIAASPTFAGLVVSKPGDTGAIIVWDTTTAKFIAMTHDSTDGNIATTAGNINLFPTGGTVAVIGGLSVTTNATIAGSLIHSGDVDTNIAFTDNTIDMFAGGGADLIRLNTFGVHLNAQQGEFRTLISGNNITDLIHVDAVNDRVGIGIGTPNNLLHVHGTAQAVVLASDTWRSFDETKDIHWSENAEGSLVLDGAAMDYVTVDNLVNDINMGTGTFTGWFNLDTAFVGDSGTYVIIDTADSTGTDQLFIFRAGINVLRLRYRQGGVNVDAETAEPGTGWFFVAGTWNTSGDLILYLGDPGLGASATTDMSARVAFSPDGAKIGVRSAGDIQNWPGMLSDITVWNTDLTQGQLEDVYDLGRNPTSIEMDSLDGTVGKPDFDVNCISWWPFTTDATDEKELNDGTFSGSARIDSTMVDGLNTSEALLVNGAFTVVGSANISGNLSISGELLVPTVVGKADLFLEFSPGNNLKSVGFADTTSGLSSNVRFQTGTNEFLRSTSAMRNGLWKHHIEPLEPDSDKFMQLRPSVFQSRHKADDQDKLMYGLYAEDVEKVYPNLAEWSDVKIPVDAPEDEPQTIVENMVTNYDTRELIALMVAEIQSNIAKIYSLEQSLVSN